MLSLVLVFQFWNFKKNPWCDISIKISTDLNPPNLTDLEYKSRKKLTMTSRDGLMNM